MNVEKLRELMKLWDIQEILVTFTQNGFVTAHMFKNYSIVVEDFKPNVGYYLYIFDKEVKCQSFHTLLKNEGVKFIGKDFQYGHLTPGQCAEVEFSIT